MKRTISLLLCAAMLLALAACGTAAPAPTPEATPVPTPTPTPTPDPTELALVEFEDAMDALSSAAGLKAEVNVDLERIVRGHSLPETISETFYAHDLQGDSPIIRRVQDMSFCDYEYGNEYVFYNDKVFLNSTYSSPISAKDYMESLYVLHLFEADNFSSVRLEGEELIFEEPRRGENWLEEGAELITANARARLSEGNMSFLSYEASYEQGAVDVNISISIEFVSFEPDYTLRAFAPAGFDIVELEDIRIAELYERAYAVAAGSPAQTSSSFTVYTVTAGNVALTDQLTLNSWGIGEDVQFKEELSSVISAANGSEEWGYTANYKDGSYTIDTNGDITTEPLPQDELDLSFVLAEYMFHPSMLGSMEFRELNGYYYIEFMPGEELGQRTQAIICDYIFSDARALDSISTDYKTDSYYGWLSFDADSLLPVSYGLEYAGRHYGGAMSYPITLNHYVDCDFASRSAYEAVFGEKPEEAEPENKTTPLFYKVSGQDGQEMWLLGTIHAGDERTAYLPESIYAALDESDALAVEIDINNMESALEDDPELLKTYVEAYMYTDRSKLEDHIAPELYEAAMDMLRACGGYMVNTTDYMKAAVIGSMIETNYITDGSLLDPNMGVDLRLLALAEEKGIEIREVEDLGAHLDTLYSRSDELQELLLREAVESNRAEYAAEVEELFELWCQGDEAVLTEKMREGFEDVSEEELPLYEEYIKAMETDRNAIMHNVAVEYLESGETVFFAVGLAHLLAEDGLVHTLREAGYTVELVG